MIDIIGPLGITIGGVFLGLCSHIEVFFKIPENELEELENENTFHIVSEILSRVDIEKFKDPLWINSFRKYYNREIKDIGTAEIFFDNIKEHIRMVKIGLIFLGIIFFIMGVMYMSIINFKIIENVELLSQIELLFSFSIGLMSLFILENILGFRKKKNKYEEILQSQKLIQRRIFLGGLEIEETE